MNFILSKLFFVHLGFATKRHTKEIMSSTETSTVFYNLQQGSLQQFEIEDDSGETCFISAEESQQLIIANNNKKSAYRIM